MTSTHLKAALIAFTLFPLSGRAHGGEAIFVIGFLFVVFIGFFVGVIAAAYRKWFLRAWLAMTVTAAVMFGPVIYALSNGSPYADDSALAMAAALATFILMCVVVPAAGLVPGWLFVAFARWLSTLTERWSKSPRKE